MFESLCSFMPAAWLYFFFDQVTYTIVVQQQTQNILLRINMWLYYFHFCGLLLVCYYYINQSQKELRICKVQIRRKFQSFNVKSLKQLHELIQLETIINRD